MNKKKYHLESYNLGKAIGKKRGMIVQIIVRDGSGSKVDYFTFNASDKSRQKLIECIIRDKYDIIFGIQDKEIFDF